MKKRIMENIYTGLKFETNIATLNFLLSQYVQSKKKDINNYLKRYLHHTDCIASYCPMICQKDLGKKR